MNWNTIQFIHFQVMLTEEREPVSLSLNGPEKARLQNDRYVGVDCHLSPFPKGTVCLPKCLVCGYT